MYKRVLLKLSGEQLAGKYEFGVDPDTASFLAAEVKKVVDAGCQVAMIVGGGNMVRGAKLAGHGIRRVTADQMGMLSGLINSMAMTDIFESNGLPTRCLSNIFAEQVSESYSYRLAEKHLQNGRVVIIAGGTGPTRLDISFDRDAGREREVVVDACADIHLRAGGVVE